jgi:hypothetical protein
MRVNNGWIDFFEISKKQASLLPPAIRNPPNPAAFRIDYRA